VRDLQGAWNFRDVADTTGVLRPGRLFRSGELSELGNEGRDELRRLGVTDVADLRSRSEVLRHGPGLVPDGVDIHLLPIPDLAPDEVNPDGEAPTSTRSSGLLEDKPDDEPVSDAATRYMVDEYSRFPTYPGAQQALHRVVSLLADGRRVLAHCFAGKDRTGFTVALVLEAAGVDRDAIVADFLQSNRAVPHLRERILDAIRERSDVDMTPELMSITEARLSEEVLGVARNTSTPRAGPSTTPSALSTATSAARTSPGPTSIGCAPRCWLKPTAPASAERCERRQR